MERIELYDKDERKINLDSLGLRGLKLTIPSPSYAVESEQIEGMDGTVEIARRLLPRELTAHFLSDSNDYQDSLNKRSVIYGLLGTGGHFYVEESKHPGVRWRVRMGEWNPERINGRFQEFEIPITANQGVSETIITHPKKFVTQDFQFRNEGTRGIDMRSQTETEIEFKGASTNLTITNKTTGDVWRYNGSTAAGDTILLKGVRSTKNGNSIFGQTNHKLISFAPGWNDIEVGGSTNFTLTIRTRFYFL